MPFANSAKTGRKSKRSNESEAYTPNKSNSGKGQRYIEYFLAICAVGAVVLAILVSLIYTGYVELNSDGISGIVRKIIFNHSSYGDDFADRRKNTGDDQSIPPKPIPVLDRELYDKKIYSLAHRVFPIPDIATTTASTTTATIPKTGSTTVKTIDYLWPVKTDYPKAGAILPFKRVVAYYGNLYSKQMGALGEYPEDEMLAKLSAEVDAWTAADPETPAIPALHYIAVTAQQSRGDDGKYRARMPYTEIDKVLGMADKIGAIVFLDFQLGSSTLAEELPIYSKYLELPNVHLGIDPEFAMLKSGKRPGTVVGTLDATDINFASEYLAGIVNSRDLPPKILVVHRYTRPMVTNYKQIITRPEVQIVIHMDGWGDRPRKLSSYNEYVYKEPVQFTGFKLFYKNDIRAPGTPIPAPKPAIVNADGSITPPTSSEPTIMSPAEVIKLNPAPIYIQYQ